MSRVPSLLLLILGVFALCTAACGTRRYAYAPVKTTSAEVVGRPAAEYAFPPAPPQGRVKLATFGLARPTDESPPSVHLRMELTNRTAEPWVIDKSEQKLELELGGRKVTIPAIAPSASASRVQVAPGGSATLDLFFPLPPGAQDAKALPAFAAIWTVQTGPRVVTTRTPFERFQTSIPMQNVPRPGHPYDSGDRRDDAPDTRKPPPRPDPIPIPDPMPVPGPP
jgi:hypothetical protein